MMVEIKNKLFNANKDKKEVVKHLIAHEKTNTFGGWNDCYISYNIELKMFAIYKRYSHENIKDIELYFNDFAEQLIEEALELYEINHTVKSGENFIALHFHKLDLKLKEFRK
ncbi:hypothetical protein [Methylotenera sp. 1P/1]|uniref:hypothetical protein n=1 Tax=Methylotenera sp. 1P/1 TaxID=1131551 RepID=UPI00036987EE|nr:hypothetical protein [Methylotenera sp. 1P/1]